MIIHSHSQSSSSIPLLLVIQGSCSLIYLLLLFLFLLFLLLWFLCFFLLFLLLFLLPGRRLDSLFLNINISSSILILFPSLHHFLFILRSNTKSIIIIFNTNLTLIKYKLFFINFLLMWIIFLYFIFLYFFFITRPTIILIWL